MPKPFINNAGSGDPAYDGKSGTAGSGDPAYSVTPRGGERMPKPFMNDAGSGDPAYRGKMTKKKKPPRGDLRGQAEKKISRRKTARMPETPEALSPEEARQMLHELRVHQIELEIQNEELRRTQAELEVSQARYFDLYDLAPVGYVTVSEKGLILEANLAAATLLGAARGALIKQRVTRFILPEDQNIYYRHRKLLFETGAPQVCEMRMVRADTDFFWARIEATAAQDDGNGASVCRVAMSDVTERKQAEEALRKAHDELEKRVAERTEALRWANEELQSEITERKQMEETLLRARKLEALGILAGGIAHDFNNLTMVVQGSVDLAIDRLSPKHDAYQFLEYAHKGMDQAKELTSRLITFSRGGSPFKNICDVAKIVRDAVGRTVKGTNVGVRFDFPENIRPAEIDELQMKQVFYNLTTNAVEAMPKGGSLAVLAENVEIRGGNTLPLNQGSYLRITFTDEGVGIPEDHLTKVFDPYFTTKEMGEQKGMGLGLSVCYSVLMKHGGHITVESHPGKGASFVLYLPVYAYQAKKKRVKKTLPPGTARVLIMDDDYHIRRIERAYLERLGYEVTEVKDGREAIETYKKAFHSGTPFDLVILDLTVPQGWGGRLTLERLLKIDPDTRAVIASGYVNDPIIENYGDYGFQGALKKPFKREEVKKLVEKILYGKR